MAKKHLAGNVTGEQVRADISTGEGESPAPR
jgi:hypothetical protein